MDRVDLSHFPEVTWAQWKAQVEKSLKGRSLVQALGSKTWDNLNLQPLYTHEEGRQPNEEVDVTHWRRGRCGGEEKNSWKLGVYLQNDRELWQEDLEQRTQFFQLNSEQVYWHQVRSFYDKAQESVVISFPLAEMGASQSLSLGAWEDESVRSLGRRQESFWLNLQGGMSLALHGNWDAAEKERQHVQHGLKGRVSNSFMGPKDRYLAVNVAKIHNMGGTSAQEVAWALAATLDWLRQAGGGELSNQMSRIVYHWAFDAEYFEQIAKLRAFRLLLADVLVQSGLQPMIPLIKGESSMRMWSGRDSWNNVLRSTLSLSAAVLGGVDYFVSRPHDFRLAPANYGSHRLARTTQLMLQEESHLDGVIDPLGGSWYVETLTEELADKAWSLFQETEELGGLWGSLKAGWWQERIKVIQDQRRTALAQRQPVIVGVSDFTIGADEQTALADNIGPSTQGTSIKVGSSKGGDIPLLADFFDGEAFESLVRRAHEKKLQPIGLLNLGSLAEHNARTIFAQNFLAAGGISAENSESLSDISKLLEKAKVSQWRHVVLCSSDELYSEHLLSIAQELKMMDVHSFWVAGKAETAQQEEEWTRAGVTGFIHRGCDVPETLSILMDTLGGEV